MAQGPMHTKTAESLPTEVAKAKPAPDKSVKDSRDERRGKKSQSYN